ncbi:MAG: hypothetical protein JJU23_15320, partial [Cyclobacteriaceae bacterium]|nr:hypothetical protein [Cyclobacteriaceae bacterium]
MKNNLHFITIIFLFLFGAWQKEVYAQELSVDFNIDIAQCPGDNSILAVTVSGGTQVYNVVFNRSILPVRVEIDTGPGTYIFETTVPGNYTINVEEVDTGEIRSQSVAVPNIPPLVVDAGDDTEICGDVGVSVQLGGEPTASGGIAGDFSYSWEPVDFLDDPTSPNPIATPNGTITYTLTVIDGNGCTQTGEVTVGVNPSVDEAILSIDETDDTFCIGDEVTFRAELIGGTAPFELDIENVGTVSNYNSGEAINFILASDGDFTFSIINVIDAEGCSVITTTGEIVLTVNPLPDAGEDNQVFICDTDASINLFDQLGGTPDPGGEWFDVNGDPVSGVFDPSGLAAGDYLFTYLVSAPPCDPDEAVVTVTVVEEPDASLLV